MPAPTEKEVRNWIRRARQGDQDAWNLLYEKNLGCLKKNARQVARRRSLTEDEVMSHAYEGFVRAVKGFKFQRKVKFITYLWRAVFQQCQRCRRQGAIPTPVRGRFTDPDAFDAAVRCQSLHGADRRSIAESLPATALDIAASIDNDDHRAQLWEAIAELPIRDQNILIGRLHYRFTLKEVGDRMDLSQECVRKLEIKAIAVVHAALKAKKELPVDRAESTESSEAMVA